MDSRELLAIIDRLTADESPTLDLYGWVRTINMEDVMDAVGRDWNQRALDELEEARVVRIWGGGYVLYIDRIIDPTQADVCP